MRLACISTKLTLLLTTVLPTTATPPTLITPSSNSTAVPLVDLGYARYQGTYNSEYGLNIFKGYVATAANSLAHIVNKPAHSFLQHSLRRCSNWQIAMAVATESSDKQKSCSSCSPTTPMPSIRRCEDPSHIWVQFGAR